MLEEGLAGEVLETGIVHPALAHALVGEPVEVLQQQQADQEPRRRRRPPGVAIEPRQLLVDPIPVDLLAEPHQLVPHVDDLVEPRPEQVAGPVGFLPRWPHPRLLSFQKGNREHRQNGIPVCKVPGARTSRIYDTNCLINPETNPASSTYTNLR